MAKERHERQEETSEAGIEPAKKAQKVERIRRKTRSSSEKILKETQVPMVLDGKDAESLFATLVVSETPHSRIAIATDKGVNYQKPSNEDRVAMNPSADFAAAIDGVGGAYGGDKAAQFLAENLAKHPKNIQRAVEEARQAMGVLPSESSATFVSARLKIQKRKDVVRKVLEMHKAGDCRIVVTDAQGEVLFRSKDESSVQLKVDEGSLTEDEVLYCYGRQYIENWIGNSSGSLTKEKELEVTSGCRAYLMSDGIGDNLTPEEIASLCTGKSVEDAIHILSDITGERMRNYNQIKGEANDGSRRSKGSFSDGYLSAPKPDNRAVAIIDIK